jgi:hypothetical protein
VFYAKRYLTYCKQYDGYLILRDITLRYNKGQRIAICRISRDDELCPIHKSILAIGCVVGSEKKTARRRQNLQLGTASTREREALISAYSHSMYDFLSPISYAVRKRGSNCDGIARISYGLSEIARKAASSPYLHFIGFKACRNTRCMFGNPDLTACVPMNTK